MAKPHLHLGWMGIAASLGLCVCALDGCTREISDEPEFAPSPPTSGGGSNGATGGSLGKGGSAAAATGGNGSTANGGTSLYSNTNAVACPGVPARNMTGTGMDVACQGVGDEVEHLPVDMVILMDRSISNSYAVGSNSATTAAPGELRRWDVLTAAMEALATAPEATELGASITFFSLNGGTSDATNCNAADYAQPVVPLGLLSTTGPEIVAAMRALSPAGLTPTVPALTGAYEYAMAEAQRDPMREKVLVLISDGFPTQCTQKSPSDVTSVIGEAASAPFPIRTFIIGVGSPTSLGSAKFNLQNYARAGNTGKPPYVLDETAGADAVKQQLVTTLLNISSSSMKCEYAVERPAPSWVINPDEVSFVYTPHVGAPQEIPKVSNLATCAKSPNGGWYFDDPINPKKITVCPCSCANFGAGSISLIFGCKPYIEYL